MVSLDEVEGGAARPSLPSLRLFIELTDLIQTTWMKEKGVCAVSRVRRVQNTARGSSPSGEKTVRYLREGGEKRTRRSA